MDSGGQLLPAATITAAGLTAFVKSCRSSSKRLGEFFDMPLRSDIERKPTQQLGAVLRLVGLSLTKVRMPKAGGRKIYEYQLNNRDMETIAKVADRRTDIAAKSAWMTARGILSGTAVEDPIVKLLEAIRAKRLLRTNGTAPLKEPPLGLTGEANSSIQ
jgi:hypothetical protein